VTTLMPVIDQLRRRARVRRRLRRISDETVAEQLWTVTFRTAEHLFSGLTLPAHPER
jgi:hypothetical protein